VKVGHGGVVRSDSGSGARSCGPLGGSRPWPRAAFNVGARVRKLREASSWQPCGFGAPTGGPQWRKWSLTSGPLQILFHNEIKSPETELTTEK
jgi:hypothetical protein